MGAYDKDITRVKNKIEGDSGEIQASNFLKSKGYVILQTNFKTKFGEIDIIALHKNVIVFVEVKKRSTCAFGRPCEAVDYRKQQTIRRVAEVYLMMKNKTLNDVRFDVIEILGDEINQIENAF